MNRRERIVAGVVGLLVLAWFVPDLVGVLLMLFSALVVVIAVIGLLRPSLVRIPDRMAAVWAFALSVGLFVGGGMLLSPPNGESTASDTPSPVYLEHLNHEDRETVESGEDPSLGARLLDIEGMTHCNVSLQAAARLIYAEGALHRWKATGLEDRFARMESSDQDVTTYFGNALEFMDPDGRWTKAFYECDWNNETGEVVDVRTR